MQKGFAHILLFILVPIIIFGIWAYQYNLVNIRQINSFYDCQDAGYLDPRSDPPVCTTPNGQSYSWIETANPSPVTFIQQSSYKTTNWKTYTNKKIGFTIMYPPSTEAPRITQGPGVPDSESSESLVISGQEEDTAIVFSGNNNDNSDSYILDVFPYNGALEDILNGIKRSLTAKSYREKLEKNFLVDGQPSLWFKSLEEPPANYEVHFTKNGYGFGLYGSSTMDEKMMEKVAATFRFLK